MYFRIYAVGLIFQFGNNIFSSILRAVGDSAATLYFLLIASVLNIVLDLAFVAGLKWGVAGAAIATDISQAASFIAAYVYMTKKYPVFRFSPVFGYSIIWWNGLFCFGVGCTISWLYYLSGKWQIGAQVAAKS